MRIGSGYIDFRGFNLTPQPPPPPPPPLPTGLGKEMSEVRWSVKFRITFICPSYFLLLHICRTLHFPSCVCDLCTLIRMKYSANKSKIIDQCRIHQHSTSSQYIHVIPNNFRNSKHYNSMESTSFLTHRMYILNLIHTLVTCMSLLTEKIGTGVCMVTAVSVPNTTPVHSVHGLAIKEMILMPLHSSIVNPLNRDSKVYYPPS